MTDLMLMGIFIFCTVTGYIVVKKSGGFLEQIFFKNPKMWYDIRKKDESGREAETGSACSQEIARDSGFARRTSKSPEKQTKSTVRRGLRTVRQSVSERAGKGQTVGEEDRRARNLKARHYKPKDYRPKDYKAGIKHEWKTN